MGDGDKVQLAPERIRQQARDLVTDAGDFSKLMEGAKQGLRSAAVDAAPWFSAGGWGMFNKPATAADEAERFVTQVGRDIESMGETLDTMMRNLADVDVNSSTDLDRIGKVIYRDE